MLKGSLFLSYRVCYGLEKMSRAAASKASKEQGKANAAIKAAQKEREKSLGLTGPIKQAIGSDAVLCKACGATQLGPDKCECPGGRVKLAADDDGLAELIAAAKLRMAASAVDNRTEAMRNASSVAKQRANNKTAREEAANDLNAEYYGDDGVEMFNQVEFAVGKLGMEIEKNVITKITEGQAAELKVEAGWVIHRVDGDDVAPDKKAIAKAISGAMKKGPVKIGFRVPLTAEFTHCAACNKFFDVGSFEEGQLEKGPGAQMCSGCEEFAEMGDFGD